MRILGVVYFVSCVVLFLGFGCTPQQDHSVNENKIGPKSGVAAPAGQKQNDLELSIALGQDTSVLNPKAQGPKYALVTLRNNLNTDADNLAFHFELNGAATVQNKPDFLANPETSFCPSETNFSLASGGQCLLIFEATQLGFLGQKSSLIFLQRNGQDYATIALSNRENLYAGGSLANPTLGGYFARWDGVNWVYPDGNAPGNTLGVVTALTVDHRGRVYVADAQTDTTTFSEGRLRTWDGSQLSTPLLENASGTIHTLVSDEDNNKLYVGGSFAPLASNRPETAYLAQTDLNTTVYPALWSGVSTKSFNNPVYSLAKSAALTTSDPTSAVGFEALSQESGAYNPRTKSPLIRIFQVVNTTTESVADLSIQLKQGTAQLFSLSHHSEDYSDAYAPLCTTSTATFTLGAGETCLVILRGASVDDDALPGVRDTADLILYTQEIVLAKYQIRHTRYLYAGGTFTSLHSSSSSNPPANHVARFDGTKWSALDTEQPLVQATEGNMDNEFAVNALAVDPGTGRLYVGGSFGATVNAQRVQHLIRWDGTEKGGWSSPGPGNGVNRTVYFLKYFLEAGDPSIVAGGHFTALQDDTEIWKLGHYSLTSNSWSTFRNFNLMGTKDGDWVRDVLLNIRGTETFVAGKFNLDGVPSNARACSSRQDNVNMPALTYNDQPNDPVYDPLYNSGGWKYFMLGMCGVTNEFYSLDGVTPPQSYSISGAPHMAPSRTNGQTLDPHFLLDLYGVYKFKSAGTNYPNTTNYISWGTTKEKYRNNYIALGSKDGTLLNNNAIYDAETYRLTASNNPNSLLFYNFSVGAFANISIYTNPASANRRYQPTSFSGLVFLKIYDPTSSGNLKGSEYLGDCYVANSGFPCSSDNGDSSTDFGGLHGGQGAKTLLRVPVRLPSGQGIDTTKHGTFFIGGSFTGAGSPVTTARGVVRVNPDDATPQLKAVGEGFADGEVRALVLGDGLDVTPMSADPSQKILDIQLLPYEEAAGYYINEKTRGPLFKVISIVNRSTVTQMGLGIELKSVDPKSSTLPIVLETDPRYTNGHNICDVTSAFALAPDEECVVIVRGLVKGPLNTTQALLRVSQTIGTQLTTLKSFTLNHQLWLVAGGSFTSLPKESLEKDTPTFLTALFDGQNWQPVSSPAGETLQAGGWVLQVAPSPTGALVLAGKYATVSNHFNGLSSWYLSSTNQGKWLSLGRSQGEGLTQGGISSLIFRKNQLYFGGNFTADSSLGKNTVQNFAYYLNNTWFGIAAVPTGAISSLIQFSEDDPYLYAGGDFTLLDSENLPYIARWSTIQSRWSSLGSGLKGPVRALGIGQSLSGQVFYE